MRPNGQALLPGGARRPAAPAPRPPRRPRAARCAAVALPATPPSQPQPPPQQQHPGGGQPQPPAPAPAPRSPLRYASSAPAAWGSAAGRRAALASRVRDAASVEALVSVWAASRAALGPAELALIFHQLARVADPAKANIRSLEMGRALLRELLIAAEDRMPQMAGPEFAFIMAALGRLRGGPDTAWLNRWMAVSRGKLEGLTAEQLAVSLRALCRLDVPPREIRACIAFPAWMAQYASAIRPRLAQLSAVDGARLLGCLAELGHRPDRGFVAAWCAAMQPKLASLDAGALARLLGCLAALRHEPDPSFMRAFSSEVYSKLPLFDDRDLATALTALTTLKRLARVDFLGEFLEEVAEKLPTFGPKALGNVLWALGELNHPAPPEWIDRVASHLEGRLWRFHGRALAGAAWGLARAGHRPGPAWVGALLDATASKLRSLGPEGLVMLAQALAAYGYAPQPGGPEFEKWARWWEGFCLAAEARLFRGAQVCEFLIASASLQMPIHPQALDTLLSQLVAGGLNHAPVSSLVAALSALGAQGVPLSKAFLNTVAQITRFLWSSLTPRETALVVAMLGGAGHAPKEQWTVEMCAQMHCSLPRFDAPSAAAVLWGLARMAAAGGRAPSGKFVADFAGAFSAGGFAAAGAPALARGLWGAAELGHRPAPEWLAAWEARAVGVGWGAFSADAAAEAAAAFAMLGGGGRGARRRGGRGP